MSEAEPVFDEATMRNAQLQFDDVLPEILVPRATPLEAAKEAVPETEQLERIEPLRHPDGTPYENEAFMISPEGKQLLADLLASLNSNDIVQDFTEAFRAANIARQDDTLPPTFISQLMKLDILEGLDIRTSQGIFRFNPAIDQLHVFINRAHHDGNDSNEKLYKNVRTIMKSIVRAQSLTGDYDPDSYWKYSERLHYKQGQDHTIRLSGRLTPEMRIVTRPSAEYE